MIASIGEMALSFVPEGNLWKSSYSGVGYLWASMLREKGADVLLECMLPHGKTGDGMRAELEMKGILYDESLCLPLPPAVSIGDEWFIRGSAPSALDAEKLSYSLSVHPGIDRVVISSVLLSYNPASSAIIDGVSFMYPLPRIAVDTSVPDGAAGSTEMMEKAVSVLRSSFPDALITENREEILSFLTE